jgi:hypothetical protein
MAASSIGMPVATCRITTRTARNLRPVSVIFTTQLTAVLAVFAVVTAFYARQAFCKQSQRPASGIRHSGITHLAFEEPVMRTSVSKHPATHLSHDPLELTGIGSKPSPT